MGYLARLRRVRDRIDREYTRPLDIGGVRPRCAHVGRAPQPPVQARFRRVAFSYPMNRRI